MRLKLCCGGNTNANNELLSRADALEWLHKHLQEFHFLLQTTSSFSNMKRKEYSD